MFDKLKSMTALAGLMQNKAKVEEAAERVKREMQEVRCDGEAGGGAVRVTVGGDMMVLAIEMTPVLAAGLAASDSAREYAQTLVRDATNGALVRARERVRQIVQREADALGIGDLTADLGGMKHLLP